MKKTEGKKRKEQYFLVTFKHTFSLLIPNFSEITAIQMPKFSASCGEEENEKQSFLWGNYVLCISYRTIGKEEVLLRTKTLSRGFSFILDAVSVPRGKRGADGMREAVNISCDAKYDYHLTPLSPALFSFFSKLRYIPFKVLLTVSGKIYATVGDYLTKDIEAGDGEFCQGLLEAGRRKRQDAEEKKLIPEVPEEPLREEIFRHKKEPGKEIIKPGKLEGKSATIVLGKKEKGSQGIPFPDPKYYQKYRTFYDLFLKEPILIKTKPSDRPPF